MPSEEEVKAQLANIEGIQAYMSAKSISALPSILWEDEVIEDAVSGRHEANNGLLAATNKRALFVRAGLIGGVRVEDMPLSSISSIQYNTGMMYGSITMFVAGNKLEVDNIQKARVRPFAERLRARVTAAKEPAAAAPAVAAPAAPQAVDVADQVRKLAALRDEGILTQEEFDAKKRQLLGL